MRLLTRDRGRIIFTIANETSFTVPYAILSHTWGEEEVSFQDVQAGKINRKVLFALEHAERDGFEHVWVDTCCIDKTSSSELSESINLMWKWYANAAVCYVYLHGPIDGNRWFTRGWTLQELIAPQRVNFFCNEVLQGTREELVDLLCVQSRIDRAVLLQHTPLQQIDFVQRYSWMSGRHTKKEEDLIYCLLGLFDVAMPLLYGVDLHHIQQDFLDQIDKRHGRPKGDQLRSEMLAGRKDHLTGLWLMESLRFENMASRYENIKMPVRGTCDWLLQHKDYKSWLYSVGGSGDTASRFFWIKGHPGAGKSTLMKFVDTEARRFDPRLSNGEVQISFYFNARGSLIERSTQGLLRSLLAQLLARFSSMQSEVCTYLHDTGRGLAPVWTIALLQQLFTIVIHGGVQPVRCFIDALDECSLRDIRDMVQFLSNTTQNAKRPFYVCFASRYYPALSIAHCTPLRLEDQQEHALAIEHYIERTLCVNDDSFGRIMRESLISKANGVFMWVVLVVQQLNLMLGDGKVHNLAILVDTLPPDLNDLYLGIISAIEDIESFKLCIQLIHFSDPPLLGSDLYHVMLFGLGLACIDDHKASTPTPDFLRQYVSATSHGLAELVSGDGNTVQFIHESVRDFLAATGLDFLFPKMGETLVSASHERIKQILADYLNRLTLRCIEVTERDEPYYTWLLDDGRMRQVDAHGFEWDIAHWLPLLPLAARRVLKHGEHGARQFDPDDFLQELDWEGLALALCLLRNEPMKDMPHIWSSKTRAYGLLLCSGAFRLASRVLNLPKPARNRILGSMPVTEAAVYGRMKDLTALLERGFDIDEADVGSQTALQRIIRIRGKEEMAVFLVWQGANVERRSFFGNTLLMEACTSRNSEVVRALVERGVDLDSQADNGQTALMKACEQLSQETVQVLIDHGAAVDLADAYGRTALFYYTGVQARSLLDAGANVNKTDIDGDTPLCYAITTAIISRKKSLWKNLMAVDLVLLLLANGASPAWYGSRRQLLLETAMSRTDLTSLFDLILYNSLCGQAVESIDYAQAPSFEQFGKAWKENRALWDYDLFRYVQLFQDYSAHLRALGQWKHQLRQPSTANIKNVIETFLLGDQSGDKRPVRRRERALQALKRLLLGSTSHKIASNHPQKLSS